MVWIHNDDLLVSCHVAFSNSTDSSGMNSKVDSAGWPRACWALAVLPLTSSEALVPARDVHFGAPFLSLLWTQVMTLGPPGNHESNQVSSSQTYAFIYNLTFS